MNCLASPRWDGEAVGVKGELGLFLRGSRNNPSRLTKSNSGRPGTLDNVKV